MNYTSTVNPPTPDMNAVVKSMPPKTFNNVMDEICSKQFEAQNMIREIRNYFLGETPEELDEPIQLKGLYDQANLMNDRQDDILRNLNLIREMLGVKSV